MRNNVIRGIIGFAVVTITLLGLSCAHDKTAMREAASAQTGQEKYLQGVEASRKVVVAKVNGVDITMKELLDRMNQIAPKYVKNPNDMTPELDQKVQKEALDSLILRELSVQEATRQGMKVNPDTIDHIMSMLKTKKDSGADFEQMLKITGETEESFRKRLEKDELFKMIVEKEIVGKVKIDDNMIQEAYSKDKGRFALPDEIYVEDIVVSRGADDAATMETAKKLLVIMRAHDNDPSALPQDGTFTLRRVVLRENDPTGLYEAASRLNEKGLSDVVTGANGLHILKVVKKEAARPMSVQEAHDQIEQELKTSLLIKRKQEWEARLKKDANIELPVSLEIKKEGSKN